MSPETESNQPLSRHETAPAEPGFLCLLVFYILLLVDFLFLFLFYRHH
jgi:hypothetical protein